MEKFMDKDLNNHDWGSFESSKTVNKLMLMNYKDLTLYLKTVIPAIYNARMTDDFVLCFKDGLKIKFEIKKVE